MRFLVLAGLFFLPAFSISLEAAEWTEFLGPRGDGISEVTSLPVKWAESENIVWKTPVPGVGWSSPVVAANRVYLTTAVPTGDEADKRHSLRAVCIDAGTGAIIWDTEVFHHEPNETVEFHQKNSHASPTPILEGDNLYVHFGSHGTACLTTAGKIVWTTKELKYAPQHGNGGSPAIAGELLIICCDGKDIQYVAGLRKDSGKLAWKTDRDTKPARGFSFCTPTIIEVNGEQQAICPGSSAVFAYEPGTGKEIWRVDYGDGYSVVPRPQYANGLVYVCSGFGDEQVFAIDPTGRGNVTSTHVKWSTKKLTPKSPSFLLTGPHLFMVSDSGIASCLNAMTGEHIWQERLGGNFSASPFYAAGRVYFQSETGTTTVVEATGEYRELAKNQIGDGMTRTFASFAVVDDDILLRSESHLYRIGR